MRVGMVLVALLTAGAGHEKESRRFQVGSEIRGIHPTPIFPGKNLITGWLEAQKFHSFRWFQRLKIKSQSSTYFQDSSFAGVIPSLGVELYVL